MAAEVWKIDGVIGSHMNSGGIQLYIIINPKALLFSTEEVDSEFMY